jgi:hypothetical protein
MTAPDATCALLNTRVLDGPPHIGWARGVMLLGATVFMGAGHILDRRAP